MGSSADSATRDALVDRLGHLAIETPPFRFPSPSEMRTNRGPAARRRVRRRNLTFALLSPAACVLLLAAADPSATLQLSRDALQAAGLTRSQVVPMAGEARHGATTIRVTGGYADDVNTVVFAEIDMPPGVGLGGTNRSACPPADLATETCQNAPFDFGIYLVDQFGQRYGITGGMGIGVGPYPMSFEPLRGAALTQPAQLTLHMRFEDGANTAHPSPFELVVPLSGRLAPHRATPLAVPPPVVDSSRGVTYAIVGLERSDAYLEVHTRLTGNLRSVITHTEGSSLSGDTYPGVFLVDTSGRWSLPLVVSGPGRATITDSIQDETRIFGAGSGTYGVVVAQVAGNAQPGAAGTVILAQWTVSIR